LAQIDWSRYNQDFFGMLGETDYDANTNKYYLSKARGGGNAPTKLTEYLRSQIGLQPF
jgi:hypothetical protein